MQRITPERLGSLLDAHGGPLRLYARQFVRGEAADDAADDVVQDAFVQLARRTSMPDDPVGWLYRVVRNGALSVRRSAARRRRRETTAAAEREPWFQSAAEARLDGETAVAALESLTDELREPVVAHLWGGLTFEQIAQLTGTSPTTAHRRYEQGLRALREKLEGSCRNTNRSHPS